MRGFEEKALHLSETQLPFSAFINSSGLDVKCHWHNHLEMLYLISGKAIVQVESEEFEFSKEDFLIINSNETHFTTSLENPKYLVIQFKASVINTDLNSLSEAKYLIPFLQKELNYAKHIKLKPDSKLKGLLSEILDDFEIKYPGYELNIRANIYKIFSWLIRNNYFAMPAVEGTNSIALSRISSLLEYVHCNFQEDISVETASEKAFMSYHHFCRTFKTITGKTFIEYLNFIRLREAEKLLVLSDRSVTDIALQVGFQNASYFTRLFTKSKGMSPLSYRKYNRKQDSIEHKSAKTNQS